MSESENLRIARRYLAVLSSTGGSDELNAILAEDIVQEEFPNRLMPKGATRGIQAMREGYERGNDLLVEQAFELVNAVASGETVAMEVVWTGTIRAAVGQFAAGQALRARFALFLEFRDGKIVHQRNYDCFDPW